MRNNFPCVHTYYKNVISAFNFNIRSYHYYDYDYYVYIIANILHNCSTLKLTKMLLMLIFAILQRKWQLYTLFGFIVQKNHLSIIRCAYNELQIESF